MPVRDTNGEAMGVDVRMSLQPDPYAPSRARREVLTACTDDMSVERCHDIALVVSELVSNSVQHGGLGPDAAIRLSIDCTDRRVRVEVQDEGPGLDGEVPAEASRWGGRGLAIVERLSARWGFHGAYPATVWAELSR